MVEENTALSYLSSLPIEKAYETFRSSEHGLTEHEARQRTRIHGLNILAKEKKKHWLITFLTNFKNPLVLILLFASCLSLVLGQVIDATIITTIILFSTILNFFQEYHANKAAEKLRERVSTRATVIRDGKEKELKVAYLCIGDIIQLHAGDIVPADARIITAKDLFVNQSSLTGESFPIEKSADLVDKANSSLSDLTNIVFSGTTVTSGSATAIIVQTGKQTEFGKIAETLQEAPTQNEFTLGIRTFSLLIMRITIFFVLFIFLVNITLKQESLFTSFTFAIAIAVGLTPELLPMIMSVTMAKGSINMARKGVIVKKLTSIPAFGEMDVLCTDKTGTLTEDHIELVTYTDIQGSHSETVLLHAYLNSFYQTGIKNPLDEAVIRYKHEDVEHYKKIDEIPFDFVRKRMSVIVERSNNRTLVTKGAPEEVIKICTRYPHNETTQEMNEEVHALILKQYQNLSKHGFRVLAIAQKVISEKKTRYDKHDENDLTFVGFVAFLDPAKKGVKEVLHELEQIGIAIKIITGDSELVTQKICRDVDLPVKGVLLGQAIQKMTSDEIRIAAEQTTIFARCSPEQKRKVLHAIKAHGHVVGYLGDGINDAPSLQTADIGISVNNAVDVAKESADMILTHKSLQELKDGVLEGRKTFGNTLKYIMMGISSNFGNMFSVLGAVFFLPYLPMLPIQILLNNLLYDLSQLAIPADNVDEEYVQKPKKWDMKFIKYFMFVFGPISSLFDFITFFILYGIFHAQVHVFQTGWFLESLATQTIIIHFIRTRHTPFLESTASKYLLFTTFGIIALGWSLPYTYLGKIFSFVPLPPELLIAIAGTIILYGIFVELGKRIFYKYYYLHAR